jgi:hypothetical protein
VNVAGTRTCTGGATLRLVAVAVVVVGAEEVDEAVVDELAV